MSLDDIRGCTPLWHASCEGMHEVIERLIASGRDLGDMMNKKGEHWNGNDYSALEVARKYERTEVVSVLGKIPGQPCTDPL